MLRSLAIFSGNANRELADEICRYVEVPPGNSTISSFSDGESYIEIGENVRGVNCFVIQPTCTPVNQNLMEMLVMIDALRRASAGSIIAIMPYFGYARQDRKVKPRTPISAKLVADLITAAGATRVVAMDLHAGQIQGFFNIPFDHLYAMPVLIEHIREHERDSDLVIVSPDAGGVERARAYAKRLRASMAIIDKRRQRANVSEVMNIIGSVTGKVALIIDDMIDTAGTLTQAAQAVMDAGASRVIAAASHGVFSGPAIQRLRDSVLESVIVTNSIPLAEDGRQVDKIVQLSVARLLGEAVKRIHHGDSISSLFI
ncbi:MAG: ribose-phosphate pyrophosphokinase [Myxococcales bacterium]|nr:ribose-phosphate pyrophosphokinase [Myxococcales bacterium]